MNHAFWLVIIMALATIATRLTPFLLFDHGTKPPAWIITLGDLLPPACMSVLIVYCIRNVDVFSGSHGIPDFLSIAAVVVLHAWKRNTLLSICAGTLLYMFLVQAVF